MKIAIGSDHAGFELKEQLIAYLTEKKIEVNNKGCYSLDRADYPDFGHAVAISVLGKEVDFGILICGSGVGISISANRHKKIRAALCFNKAIAKLARSHNNANVICLGARFLKKKYALAICKTFFTQKFDGQRHVARVEKLGL